MSGHHAQAQLGLLAAKSVVEINNPNRVRVNLAANVGRTGAQVDSKPNSSTLRVNESERLKSLRQRNACACRGAGESERETTRGRIIATKAKQLKVKLQRARQCGYTRGVRVCGSG
jgi:hypothetical protein